MNYVDHTNARGGLGVRLRTIIPLHISTHGTDVNFVNLLKHIWTRPDQPILSKPTPVTP